MKTTLLLLAALLTLSPATAQYTGPSLKENVLTLAEAQTARVGSYIFVEGFIIAHIREDYYRLKDDTGEIRVEIPGGVWQGREVSEKTRVRLHAEVDRSLSGRYLWVKSLQILPPAN